MSPPPPGSGVARYRFALLLIVLFAFLVRLLHVLSYDPRPAGPMAIFEEMARSRFSAATLLAPEGLAPEPPGYALFLRPLLGAFPGGAGWTAVRIAQALLGAVTVWLAASIARRLHSRRAAVAAALLACFFQQAVFSSSVYLPESLIVPLLLAGLLLSMSAAGRAGAVRLHAAGLLTGACMLTGAVGTALVPVAAWAALRSPAGGRPTRRLLWVALGCLTLAGPWTVRNWITLGSPALLTPAAATRLAAAIAPDANGAPPIVTPEQARDGEAGRALREQAAAFVTRDPWGALHLFGRLRGESLWQGVQPFALRTLNPSLYAGESFFPWVGWSVVLFGGLFGLGALALSGRRGWGEVAASAAGVVVLLTILGADAQRRLPLAALLLPCCGAAAVTLVRAMPAGGFGRSSRWPLAASVLIVAVAAESALSAAIVRRGMASPAAIAAAAAPMRVQASEGAVPIFGPGPVVADRKRGRFLRLSLMARRSAGGGEGGFEGSILISFLDAGGRTQPWIPGHAYRLDGLPAGEWAPVELKTHLPVSARAIRVEVVPRAGSAGSLRLDHATLRYAGGNTVALEMIFPYLEAVP